VGPGGFFEAGGAGKTGPAPEPGITMASRKIASLEKGDLDDPPMILFNLRRLWYASSMVWTICDGKDVVLVVDDDEEMAEEMIEDMVERRGCLHAALTMPQGRCSTIWSIVRTSLP
jgi:hypothetical protein